MLDTILGGLIVGAISALAWVAYRHAEAFERIFVPLFGLSFVIMMGILVWNAAVSETAHTLGREVDADLDAILRTKESVSVSTDASLLWFIGWTVYLACLRILPHLGIVYTPPSAPPGVVQSRVPTAPEDEREAHRDAIE